MIYHNTIQGSPEWLTLRARYLTASEAPAMMGCSPYTTRTELLEQKSTGLLPDIDVGTAMRFKNGHEVEAAYRPLAEEIIGSELYPVTGSLEVDCLPLLASFDGLTMMEADVFEHKAYNTKTAGYIDEHGEPPIHHVWQLEQQLLVSGAQRALFVTSDGTNDQAESCWYTSQPERRAALIAGWKQFQADMATWQPQEQAAPAPMGRTPETLPALHIEVTGMVTASNLAEYKAHALSVFGSINRDLKTDQDFANARNAVKWCSDVEKRLKAAKDHALSQTESIDLLFRTIDDITTEARRVRLEVDNLVKARDTTLRAEIVADGRNALADHINACNQRIGRPIMPAIPADFATAIKGMSKFQNMRDAVATELARAKISANEWADKIALNLKAIHEQTDFAFLFADAAQLVLKAPDDLAAVVQNRISVHQAKEAARIEAARARIAEQERIKAEAAAQARADAEIAAATAAAQAEAARASAETIAKAQAEQVFQPVAVVQTATEVAAYQVDVLGPPTMKLGQIADRLGFTLSANFLDSLGFKPQATDGRALLFNEADFPRMCAVLVRHIQRVAQGVPAW